MCRQDLNLPHETFCGKPIQGYNPLKARAMEHQSFHVHLLGGELGCPGRSQGEGWCRRWFGNDISEYHDALQSQPPPRSIARTVIAEVVNPNLNLMLSRSTPARADL